MATRTTQAAPKKRRRAGGGGGLKLDANGNPLIQQQKDIGYDEIGENRIEMDPYQEVNPEFDYEDVNAPEDVKADTLAERRMTQADYAMVDPSQIAREYGDINRGEIQKNADLSSKIALENLDTELRGLKNYAPAAAALKRGEIEKDNAFNQAQREAQLKAGDPNLRSDLESQAERARAFAEGRVPDSIQDRALELGVRSRAADAAAAGGFGVRSGAARKASELMSAEKRIELSKYGDQALTSNIGNRANLLLAPTEYSDAGGQIQTMPTQSAGQMAMQLSSEANAGNITAQTALASQTQQQQFKSGLEQEANLTNVNLASQRDINQAQLNLQAGMSNQQTQLNTAQFNTANRIQTQTFSNQMRSQEHQFGSQLNFNVKNANADREFNRQNANAGRSMEAAQFNRNMTFQTRQANANMIFQDRQARNAEAAANARTAMAERGANARAALSYKANQESLAAQQKAYNDQLAMQKEVGDRYQKGLSAGQSANDYKTIGSLITNAPQLIKGVTDTVNTISGWFSDDDVASTEKENADWNAAAEAAGGGL